MNENKRLNIGYWLGMIALLAILVLIVSWRTAPDPGKWVGPVIEKSDSQVIKPQPGLIDWEQWNARNSWL